jgi:hypothetical protein
VWKVKAREGFHTEFYLGNLRERLHLEDQGVNGRVLLKKISKIWDVGLA